MGYLIPVTPQAFVNRISIFGPDETNIKEISYQLSLHLTIPINIFTPPKSLELYIFDHIYPHFWPHKQFWPEFQLLFSTFSRTFNLFSHLIWPKV